MNIFIGEDYINDYLYLKKIIIKWAKERHIHIKIYYQDTLSYQIPDYLYSCDIAFLEINMSYINGFSFAEYLRKHDQHIDIVFQSHCSSYGVKSYRIRTLDYLIKPVNEKDIFRLLDTVLLKQQERFIIYKYRRKIKKIRLSDIIYLKIDKHCCSLYCLDGIEKVTCSLKTMKQYLDHHFVQCYRSYIVNIDYIEKIEDERLFLFHQQIVPVSKTYLPLLNETLWKQR